MRRLAKPTDKIVKCMKIITKTSPTTDTLLAVTPLAEALGCGREGRLTAARKRESAAAASATALFEWVGLATPTPLAA
jgi:hypothetical protein